MAFLQFKKDVPYLCEKVKADGKWQTKWLISLKGLNRKEAEKVKEKFNTDPTYLRFEIDKKKRITLSELLLEYIEYQTATPTKKPETLKHEINKLKLFTSTFGALLINKLDCDEANKWLQKYEPNTIRLHVNALKQLYDFAIRKRYISTSPIAGIHRPKIVLKPPKHIDDKTIDLVFAELSPSKKPIFEIMLYAGLRPKEVMSLQSYNINFDKKVIDLYPDQTKTASRGIIPMHDKLVDILQDILKDKKKGYLFPWGEGHQKEFKNALKGACRRASEKAGKEIYFTAYQLRHTFATRLLEKTGDIRVVQQLMRHTSILMTTRYATALDEKLREAVDKL